MIPHHLAYPSGQRGVELGSFSPRTARRWSRSIPSTATPKTTGARYLHHAIDGWARNGEYRGCRTEAGLRFGFVGSSDDHAGFPGAYGEGLMAALVSDFSRDGIFEAIRARRTYALTGDRIELDFSVDGAPMGRPSRPAAGRGRFDGAGPRRDRCGRNHPGRARRASGLRADEVAARRRVLAPVQVRLEWGWGPWGALALDRVCDWAMQLSTWWGTDHAASFPACSRCRSTSSAGIASKGDR